MEMQTQENEIKQALDEAAQNQAQNENELETVLNEEVVAEENTTDESVAQEELDPIAKLQSENAALRAHLEKVENAAKADLQNMVRAIAEADNQRKRAEADIDRARVNATEKFARAMLPIVDSLELAIEHTHADDEKSKALVEGVQNTLTLFLKELSNFGVEVVNPLNEAFDPNVHQAISMMPSDCVAANHVVYVMQKGYVLNGRVVRPAMVTVSSGAPAKADNNESENSSSKINVEI